MKVKPPVNAASPKPDAKPAPSAKKAAVPFAQILEQKESPPPFAPSVRTAPVDLPIERAEAPAPTNRTERIAALAGEIGAKVEPAAVGTVTISFDAKTFEGLQVNIAREQGQLIVRMVSQTPEVAQMLRSNVEDLRQRLEERGYRKAIIQVQRAPRAEASSREKEKKPWQ